MVPTKVQYIEPQLRIVADRRREVLVPVRRRWVALTPEEEVRQQALLMLYNRYGYPMELMQVEGTITVNGMTRRCDIVVYNSAGQPQIIVECKRPDVSITQKVCDQACRYNTVLQVPCLLLTNGKQFVVIEIDYKNHSLRQLSDLPRWKEKC